jgi:hypothetical protein
LSSSTSASTTNKTKMNRLMALRIDTDAPVAGAPETLQECLHCGKVARVA